MSTDSLTQYGKSERVNIAGCWIMTSYIMKQNRIVQSGDRNAGLVRSMCRVETGMLDWCEACAEWRQECWIGAKQEVLLFIALLCYTFIINIIL